MCGVAAIWSPSGRADRDRLEAANRALAHRGPDGSGVWLAGDRSVGLAHTRLAVVGDGAQPIASEDGSVVASVNGEIYCSGGWRALRAELEGRGHRFATSTDSEVLIHLYEERGIDALERLRGELAFALWDRGADRLIAGRDRFGIKPLCYAERCGELLVASEAKALFAMGVPAAWDRAGLEAAVVHQYLPPGRSLFAGVRQLPPGHVLIADRAGIRLRRTWDLDYPKYRDDTVITTLSQRDSAVREVRAVLAESIALRLEADAPIAFHLSGGLDSSAIAGAASAAGPVDAFAVQFDDAGYDELGAAREVARWSGARLHPVPVSRPAMLEALDDAVVAAETPAINGQLPAKLILNRAIATAGFTAVLGGEGADEVFLGYAHLRADAGHAAPMFAGEVGIMAPRAGDAPPPILAERLGQVPGFLTAKVALGRRLAAVMATGVDERRALAALIDAVDLDQLRGRPAAIRSAYLWTRLALAGYILRAIGDGTEMACSLEGRLPMLDHALFERVRAIDPALVLGGEVAKPILRDAVAGWIPESIRSRPKQPFLAPPLTAGPPRHRRRLRERLADAASSPLFDRAAMLDVADRLDPADDPRIAAALSLRALERRFGLADINSTAVRPTEDADDLVA
jgi:asparagine synthase (glutamine-hydrolysing)